MARLRNMARMSVASAPGTGTITLGSAVTGWLSFANAGIQDGEVVTYFMVDGASREIGRGTYTASGTTLARTTILRSTNSNNAINATTSAQVAIGPSAEDFLREVNAQTGTSYTVLGSDLGKRVTFSNAASIAVTLPQSTSSGLFASGFYFEALNLGAGAVTITPTTSTINGSASITLKQYQSAVIVADGTNYSAIVTAGTATGLGLGTSDSPQFIAIELGHTSDTTIARASAGNITVEGKTIYRADGTDVALADGGTGASLTDPNADRIMFWDDSAGQTTWLEPTNGLSISGTTLVPAREVLTGNRTYYVRTDGSNSNTGLINNSGGAFLTGQYAIDFVTSKIDFGGKSVTIKFADGTYTGAMRLTGPWTGGGTLTLEGNTSTPANCVVSVTGGDNITGTAFLNESALPGTLAIKGFKGKTTADSSSLVRNAGSGTIAVDYFECNGSGGGYAGQISAVANGAKVIFGSGCSITGGGSAWLQATEGGVVQLYGVTYTFTGTFSFSWVTVTATRLATIIAGGATLSIDGATVTGQRYSVTGNSLIETSGGGASFYPGNSAGSASDGGLYT